MALFGLFGSKDDPAAIKRLVTKVTQKFGPPEDRQAAAERLFELKTPDALTGLLQRFTVRVDPTIVDDEQKQYVCDAMVEAGQVAVEPLKKFIVHQDSPPTWALKALEQIVPAEDTVTTILEALERIGPKYTRDPDKKITLLRHLEPSEDARIPARILPFLEDPSEDVRIATLAVLQLRPDESAREPVINVLLKSVEERSERLRRAAAEALVKAGFSVKGQRPAVEAALPPGYTIDKEGKIHSRTA
jgi:HEAT repeat protein